LTHEDFGHRKLLQILVIGDHLYRECRAFEVVSPSFEIFKNCEELFVVHIIVEFWSRKVWEWNAMGGNSPCGVVIERTAASV